MSPPDARLAIPDSTLASVDMPPGAILPPRPVAPLSTARVTSQRPLITFALPTGTARAQFELCSDHTCRVILGTEDLGAGPSAALSSTTLSQGASFWRLRGVSSTGSTGATASAVYEMFAPAVSAPTNTSWGTTLDLNGDGLADVAVGSAANVVDIYLGASGTFRPAGPDVKLKGPSGSVTFGEHVTSAGDLNGDGISDLLVTDAGANVAYVYLGAAGTTWTAPSPIVIPAPTGSSKFGNSGDSAGDLNGDGYADLAIGAFGSGAVYIYLGSGPGSSGGTWTPSAAPSMLSGSGYGAWVASSGDLNGDGLADLAVNSPGAAGGDGHTYVYLGVAGSGWTPAAPVMVNGGWGAASAGDLNGDGRSDLVTGNVKDRSFVYLGAASFTAPIGINLVGPGWSPEGAGNVNGDAFDDLIIGDNKGSAYLYLGSAGFSASTSPIVISIPGGIGGGSVAGLGDISGDNRSDIIVGVSPSSSAYVYLGSPCGIAATPIKLVQATTTGFGWDVASAEPIRAVRSSLDDLLPTGHLPLIPPMLILAQVGD